MKWLRQALTSFTGKTGMNPLETLEPRAMMSVTAGIEGFSVLPNGVWVAVGYHSSAPINVDTIGNNDLHLLADAQSGPMPQAAFDGAAQLIGAPVQRPNGSVWAQYFIAARGQTWDWADTSTYRLTLGANEVLATNESASAAADLASYWFWFTTPRVDYQSGTLTGSSWNFSVVYSDDNALNMSTIGNDDIEVYGPGGWQNQVSRAEMTHMDEAVGNSVRVFYSARVSQVAASWLNRGHYDIVMRPNQVSDAAGNSIPSLGLAAYWYWNDRPAAELISATMNSAGWNFSVRYSDDHGISLSSIHSGNIEGANIVGSPVVNADGSVVANYIIPRPVGGFSQVDGSMPLTFNANQVTDTDGNAALGGYLVPQQEFTWSNPTATIVAQNRFNAQIWDVNVRFTNTGGMNLSSLISGRAVEVRGPANTASQFGGYRGQLQVLASQPTTNGYVVFFRLNSANASFTPGRYYLRIRPHEVFDNAGHVMMSQELLAFDL
jgi:hypothetical protein